MRYAIGSRLLIYSQRVYERYEMCTQYVGKKNSFVDATLFNFSSIIIIPHTYVCAWMVFSRPIVLSYIASSCINRQVFFILSCKPGQKINLWLHFHNRNYQRVLDIYCIVASIVARDYSRRLRINKVCFFRILQINL